MLEQAIKKLKDEIGSDTAYKKIIGDFLLKQIKANPESAEMILKQDKTIKGAMDAMKAEAKKNQKDGCGVLTDEEGYAIVLKYFGIKSFAKVTNNSTSSITEQTATTEAKPQAKDFPKLDISLEDLL